MTPLHLLVHVVPVLSKVKPEKHSAHFDVFVALHAKHELTLQTAAEPS